MSKSLETIDEVDLQEITEEQLDALYILLSLNWETLTDDEKEYWKIIMEKIDKNFNDDE
jgi:hypothetical protein